MNLANKLQQNLGYGPKAFAKEIWSGYYRHQQGMISCSIVPMQKVEAIAKIYYSAKSWFDLWPYEVRMMSHKDNHWDNHEVLPKKLDLTLELDLSISTCTVKV